MASHTQSELELAASALGAAARQIGLPPEELQTPEPERVVFAEPALDVEPDGAARVFGVSRPPLDAPFDVERDAELPEVVPSAGVPAKERWLAPTEEMSAAELPDGGPDAGEAPDERGPDAPFDFERDLADARAA